MGSVALKPSPAVGRMLRSRRKEMALTLREVSERLGRMGDRVPQSTLVRIEQGKLDPGVRRLHLLLRAYGLPPHLVADILEMESLAVHQPVEGDLDVLYREGVEHWKRGDIAKGLAYLFAVREQVPTDDDSRLLRQRATLAFAVAARNLAKVRLARQMVDELLCEPPDPRLRSGVLVLAASLWRAQGSLDVALGLTRQAEIHVAADDDQNRAWVQHQLARLLVDAGQLDEADLALNAALEAYERLGDTYGRARALLLGVGLLERRGDVPAALRMADRTARVAAEHDHARVLIYARLESGRLLTLSGAIAEGLELLDRALGQAVLLGDRNAEFIAHYHLWKTHLAVGDRDRARIEREAARYYVQYVDDDLPESHEVRALSDE